MTWLPETCLFFSLPNPVTLNFEKLGHWKWFKHYNCTPILNTGTLGILLLPETIQMHVCCFIYSKVGHLNYEKYGLTLYKQLLRQKQNKVPAFAVAFRKNKSFTYFMFLPFRCIDLYYFYSFLLLSIAYTYLLNLWTLVYQMGVSFPLRIFFSPLKRLFLPPNGFS